MLNYKELCPNFWERFTKGAAVEKLYLDELDSMAKIAHAGLAQKFDLPSGVWKYEEYTNRKEKSSFELTTQLMLALLPAEEQEFVVQNNYTPLFDNKLQSGTKVSKYLSKVSNTEAMGKLIPILASSKGSLSKLGKELPKLPKEMIDPFNLITNFGVLVQNFYSEVSAASNVVFGVALDLPSFLEAANSPNFTSCYAVNGCNERAPINLAITPNTFVLYVKDKSGSVVGRCWGLINTDYSQIALLKPYGFINSEHVSSAVSWIANKCNPTSTWGMYELEKDEEDDGLLYEDLMELSSGPGIYGDPTWKILSKYVDGDVLTYQPSYTVRSAPCVICGVVHDSSQMVCSKCQEKYIKRCLSCGEKFYSFKKETEYMCSSCLSGYVICPKCGKSYPEHMDSCPHCHWETHCSLCGKKSDVPLYKAGEISLCRECRDILLSTTCDVCGVQENTYPYKGIALCAQCFTLVTKTENIYTRIAYPDVNYKRAIEMLRHCGGGKDNDR